MKGAENPNELCVETQTRLKDLFHKLDVDGDGRIDVKDLTAGLQKLGLPHSTDNAKKFIESSDLARDGVVDFQEFAQYVLEHERNLKLVFNKIDENADGHIDEEEIMSSCRKLGINIDQAEAHRLLRRMDKDGSLTINFEEWRDYLLFHPTSDLHEIISLWRHHSVMLDVVGLSRHKVTSKIQKNSFTDTNCIQIVSLMRIDTANLGVVSFKTFN